MKRLIVFLGLLVLCGITLNVNAQTQGAAEIGKPAPDFQLRDVNGKIHNLQDYRGKTVVLEWINFDCPFVVKHYSSNNMQNLQQEYVEKGVIWLAVCSSAPGKQGHFEKGEILKRISDSKAKMSAYLIDEDGVTGKLYGAKTTPHMYIINNYGNLVYQGAIDDIKSTDVEDIKKSKNYVKNALDLLLNGREAVTSTTTPYGCSVKYKN